MLRKCFYYNYTPEALAHRLRGFGFTVEVRRFKVSSKQHSGTQLYAKRGGVDGYFYYADGWRTDVADWAGLI